MLYVDLVVGIQCDVSQIESYCSPCQSKMGGWAEIKEDDDFVSQKQHGT